MKTSDLIKLLSSANEEEVFIEIDDTQYEIAIGHCDEVFDGFDTAYPACLILKPIKDYENTISPTQKGVVRND